MKFIAYIGIIAFVLAGCSHSEPDFSDLAIHMPKSEVIATIGKPDKIQYLIETELDENLLLNEIPPNTDPELVYEYWTFDGQRTYQITESRKYVNPGEITVIFGGPERDSGLVRGYWWTDAASVAARNRENNTLQLLQ